jgi:hypothetical protein
MDTFYIRGRFKMGVKTARIAYIAIWQHIILYASKLKNIATIAYIAYMSARPR